MPTRELHKPPNTLLLNVKAGASALPGASRLRFLAPGDGAVPDLRLRLRELRVKRSHLAEYTELCGYDAGDRLPPTYPHVLAFPLHLAILTDRRFPFPAVGLVHLENRIDQLRPIGVEEPLALAVWPTPLDRHRRGQSFSLVTEASVAGEPVWRESSTIIRLASRGGDGDDDEREQRGEPILDLRPYQQWDVARAVGRRYAAASGDRNPIHVYSAVARLFGFRRLVAPGMWTKARCLAALADRLPESFSVAARFRRPILLPARVRFGWRVDETGLSFTAHDRRSVTPNVSGVVSSAGPAEPRITG